MNNISEQLLQAIDIVAEQKLTQLKFDKTIQATIYSIVDVDSGEYKVKYSGNIFSAYSSDTTKTYKANDEVYVTVPEGNFSSRKLITSKVTSDSLSSVELTNLANSILEISPTFDQLYGNLYDAEASYGVIAGTPIGQEGSYAYIYQGPNAYSYDGYHGLFQQYANNYEYIRLKASFLTQFQNVHSIGNYGIEVEFYTKDDSSVSYRLDLENFNSSPYKFSTYSPQEIILKAQKNYLTGLKSIKLFEEDFEYDKIIENGIVTDNENTTVANIFVKDIVLQYVDRKDLSDTTYYLTIAAPKGIAFTEKTSKLELLGKLIYMGENIMDEKKCSCQWFERDLSVVVGSEGYSKAAGFGWKLLDGKTSNTLTLDATDILYQQRYKLVVIYNDSVTLSAETEVWNRNNEYDFSIVQVTAGADIKLQIRNNFDDEVLIGNWYLSYPDGSYSSVQEGKNQSEIIVSSYLQYSSVVFYCEVHNSKGEFIGTLEHTIVNSENEEDVTITYDGEDTFRYDANGDVSVEDAEKERTLQVNLAWKEGYGTSYFVSWLMKDENGIEHELPTSKDQGYTPDNSMIENLWVDNYNILHYNIKQKFKVNFNNNTIIVKIRTITESIYLFNKEILFLKDGDQGTNGTTYITAIRPCDNSGVKLSGLQPLRYNNGWTNNIRLRCYVYKDGELINSNSKYTIKYKWEGKNVTLENHETSSDSYDQVLVSGIPTIPASLSDLEKMDLSFYAKVQVTVTDDTGKVDIYASYPIDVLVGSALASDIEIDSIPSYIKYTSSGLTPSFYSNNINFYYQGNTYNDNIFSLNTNILTIKEQDGKKYLEPAPSFIFENVKENDESNIGVLSLEIPNSAGRLIHPIMMYLDTYGNEAINGWDGTALDTGDGEYVFAPQVGAGEKDSANRFTGVVMGKDSGQNLIGLYGYQAGVNTFGLMQDGRAFFGAKSGGGQIEINGKDATIQGGNGGDNATGMTITLANLNPGKATSAIKVGNGVFEVKYDGSVTATSATIEGTIYAKQGKIGCTSRNSKDGWTIETNRLYSGSGNAYVELNSDSDNIYAIWAGSSAAASAKFSVTKAGKIKANEGTIGGWTLTKTSFSSNNNGIGMASTGNPVFWAGASSGTPGETPSNPRFYVNRDGYMNCRDADIEGDITASTLTCYKGIIGGWTITQTSLYAGSTYLTTSGVRTDAVNIYYKNTSMGGVGMVTGADDYGTTYNMGIWSNSAVDASIILQSGRNIALRGDWIFLQGSKLSCNIAAASQFGIYARFY